MADEGAQHTENKSGAPEIEPEVRFRTLEGLWRPVTRTLAVAMSLFHIYTLGISPTDPWTLVNVHLLLGAVLIFTWIPSGKKDTGHVPWWDFAAIGLVLLSLGYVQWEMDGLLDRAGAMPVPLDVLFGWITILLVLEMNRRITGWTLPIIGTIAILYARFGNLIPGKMGHRGYDWERIASYLFGLDGIFSQPLAVSAKYVFLFILFGAFLDRSGAGRFFIELAMSLFGRIRGGPAKVAVVASALFGTISGSAVANTAGTGSFTIPMMKRVGYNPVFAGAVEAVASTGGQIMPPVMGAAAFVLADIVGLSYWKVAIAAAIPALLYFTSVFIAVDIEAVKLNLRGMPKEALPDGRKLLRAQGYLLLPLLVLILVLVVLQMSPIRAALGALAAVLLVSWFRRATAMGPTAVVDAMSSGTREVLSVLATCAAAGIVVGVLGLTGLGQMLAGLIIDLAQSSSLLALGLSMVICLVLGMGLPTTPAYIIAASVVGPALVKLQIPMLSAHLFIFYFACIAVITPPIALASYTAAGIARTDPMQVGLASVKLGLVAFIIPYMFAYNPSLLAQGDVGTILFNTATALVGVFALASGLQAYYFGRVGLILRAVLIGAALSLIKPGVYTDTLGLSLMVIAYFTRHLGRPAEVSHTSQRSGTVV
jgi:TRAP transporter 4TM/12TM fusion protein